MWSSTLIDIFSRYVVGWTLSSRECASVAHAFIEETCRRHNIDPGQLTLHADRGSPMISKPVAFLLAVLPASVLTFPTTIRSLRGTSKP